MTANDWAILGAALLGCVIGFLAAEVAVHQRSMIRWALIMAVTTAAVVVVILQALGVVTHGRL